MIGVQERMGGEKVVTVSIDALLENIALKIYI